MRILTQLYLTPSCVTSFFFFNDPAPTEIYPLSLHDALPIPSAWPIGFSWTASNCHPDPAVTAGAVDSAPRTVRSRAIFPLTAIPPDLSVSASTVAAKSDGSCTVTCTGTPRLCGQVPASRTLLLPASRVTLPASGP